MAGVLRALDDDRLLQELLGLGHEMARHRDLYGPRGRRLLLAQGGVQLPEGLPVHAHAFGHGLQIRTRSGLQLGGGRGAPVEIEGLEAQFLKVLGHFDQGEKLGDVQFRFLLQVLGGLAQGEIILAAGLLQSPTHRTLAGIVRRQGQRPVPELGIQLLQVCDGRLGGLVRVAPLVHPAVHGQPVNPAGLGHELPDAAGAGRGDGEGVETALGERKVDEVLGQAFGQKTRPDVRQIGLGPLEPPFHGPPMGMGIVVKIALDFRIIIGIQGDRKGHLRTEDAFFLGGQLTARGDVLPALQDIDVVDILVLGRNFLGGVAGVGGCTLCLSGVLRGHVHTRSDRGRVLGLLGGHTPGKSQQDGEQDHSYIDCQNNLLVKCWPLGREKSIPARSSILPCYRKNTEIANPPARLITDQHMNENSDLRSHLTPGRKPVLELLRTRPEPLDTVFLAEDTPGPGAGPQPPAPPAARRREAARPRKRPPGRKEAIAPPPWPRRPRPCPW
ncbi:hypothetical protein DSECCO2_621570 [anaerobic digester metagenome]